MIPVQSRVFITPDSDLGDCLTACVASLLELPYEEVPFFVKYNDEIWADIYKGFLLANGYIFRCQVVFNSYTPEWLKKKILRDFEGVDGYKIVNGYSVRNVLHAVIYKGDELVHDPHPGNKGIITPISFDIIERINEQKFNMNEYEIKEDLG